MFNRLDESETEREVTEILGICMVNLRLQCS